MRKEVKMPIEKRGVDTIPDEERTSRPGDLVSILLGSNLCLSVIVFGWLPPSFGLSWWASVSSIAVGTLVGTLFTSPLGLVSLHTATNLSTSSGAHFGVRGRLVGSAIGLLLALGYAALTIKVAGDVIARILHRLSGFPLNELSRVLIYLLLAAGTVAFSVLGYRVLTTMLRFLTIGMALVLALGVIAYAPHFTSPALPETGGYLMGEFWPTWFLATVTAGLSGPIAFITLLGDYTRYISPARHSSLSVLRATWIGLFFGLLVPQLFGAFTAYSSRAALDYAAPLVEASPGWFLIPLILAASAGTIGNAGLMLYSMGLDLEALLSRASRAQATYVAALAITAWVLISHWAWDAQTTVTSVILLTAIGTPWAAITLVGFARCQGVYDSFALQVFNRRSHGGVYWYRAGWNLQAIVSWAVGAGVGLLAVSLPVYEGPLLRLTGAVDCSFLLSGVVGGGLYMLLTRHQPSRRPPVGKTSSSFRESLGAI